MNTMKFRKKLFWICVLVFFIAGPPLLLYAGGWRLTSNFSIKRVGGIFVSADLSGAEIYVNKKLMKQTNILQHGLFMQGITPGITSIIVAKDGYWPWAKELPVKENLVAETRAFLLPRDISGKSILRGTYNRLYRVPDYSYLMLEKKRNGVISYEFYNPSGQQFISVSEGGALLSSPDPFKTFFSSNRIFYLVFPSKTVSIRFNTISDTLTAERAKTPEYNTSPSLPHRITVDNRSQSRVWISNEGSVNAEWLSDSPLPYYFNEKITTVFESQEQIKSLDFYRSRRDLVILAVKNSVFVLEIDGRSTRNFQPIYKGNNPYFARIDSAIYILDNGNLLEVKI